MYSSMDIRGKDIEGRAYKPAIFTAGLDQETSKFSVAPGSLSDCLNYNVTTRGYTRARGLWYYDGTLDHAVQNMWFIGVDDDESTLTGANGFTLGGGVTWDDGDSSGTVAYYDRVAGTPDYTLLGIVGIEGDMPVEGDLLTDTEFGTTLSLTGPLTYAPSQLAGARNPSNGNYYAATVTNYLNFLNGTVNSELVSQTDVVTTGTFNTYHGAVPGKGGITGGWQIGDTVYVVRDAYSVNFEYGSIELVPGEEVLVPLTGGSTEQVAIAKTVLTSGAWAQGNAAGYVIFMPSATTADLRSLDDIDTTGAYIKNLSSTNMALIPIGTTPDTALTKGLVWKGTVHGWEWVDTGWTISYGDGLVAPNVAASPLFISSLVAQTRTTGATAVSTASTVGSAPSIAWVNPTNVTTDNAAYATAALLAGESTQTLKCTIPANALPHDDIKVIGVTVTVQGKYATASGARDVDIRLVNYAVGADFYQSDNRARREALLVAATDATYGSDTDTWGVENISAADINDGNVAITLRYTNTAGVTSGAEIDYVSFDIAYVPNDERVWFHDGTTDVAQGIIHAFQIDGGTWNTPPLAYGNMSFHDIDDPGDIGVGMLMYTDAAAGGVVIATVTSPPSYNLLPSEAEMLEADSKYETIRQNYYENEEAEAIYGVTGASSAFTYDENTFSFLRTPVTVSADRPRSIAFHDNRLALGFPSGHVVISAVGVPNDFSAVDDSSSWGVGDRVTGLISMRGGVLGVFSESSIRSLEGADAEEGVMRTVSSTAGCKEYTMQNIVGPYFADNRGVSSIDASDKYGDFDMARATDAVRSWIQERVQATNDLNTDSVRPVCSVAVRNQNQYRLFFADGYILVLYFHADGTIAPTIMHYDLGAKTYVPTFINSSVLSTGRERIVMGTTSGDVWIVDGADCIQLPPSEDAEDINIDSPECYIVINPANFGGPERAHKVFHSVIQGQFFGAQTVEAWADTNYVFEQTGAAQETITFGDYSLAPILVSKNEIQSVYLEMLADGYSLKLQTTMDGSLPHTFQSILYRTSPKGADRNRVSKTY